jgi:DNA (cytosine-5)-methyltransferase 1
MKLRYATVCSGIEAMSVAVRPLGWEPVWFSEIEPFACTVLDHHYPHVPNVGDMLKI